jgi:hypothetical protein
LINFEYLAEENRNTFSENQNEFRKILVCEKVGNELISKRTKK